MNKHILSLLNGKKKVVDLVMGQAYTFSPKLKSGPHEVNEINLYDSKMINNYLEQLLEKKYQNLVLTIKKLLDEDDSEDNYQTCLGFISKYEDILLHQKKCFIKRKKYEQFLKKIGLLQEFIETKIMEFNQDFNYNRSGGRRC